MSYIQCQFISIKVSPVSFWVMLTVTSYLLDVYDKTVIRVWVILTNDLRMLVKKRKGESFVLEITNFELSKSWVKIEYTAFHERFFKFVSLASVLRTLFNISLSFFF